MKKTKLLTFVLSVGTVATVAPVVATSCKGISIWPLELEDPFEYEPAPIGSDIEEAIPSKTGPIDIKDFDEESNEELSFDLSGVETIQNWGKNTTYDIKLSKSAKSINFSLTDSSVLSASLDDNGMLNIAPKKIGSTTLTLTIKDKDENEFVKSIDLTVDSKIHEFINERTFSLSFTFYNAHPKKGLTASWYTSSGTGWLFYHETEADNDFTYYLLTNNHVTSGFMDGVKSSAGAWMEVTSVLNFAYQDWDDAKGETTKISTNVDDLSNNGEPNHYNVLDVNWSNNNSDCFKTLFTSYLDAKIGGDVVNRFYNDMTICKVDFSKYANTELCQNRLKKLNEYADKHDNKLVEFDDYSDISKKSIYTGGYPLNYCDENEGTIYKNATKFQKHIFDGTSAESVKDTNQLLSLYDNRARNRYGVYEAQPIWSADGVQEKKSVWASPDWVAPTSYDRKLRFGGGASGSLAMTATDLANEDTFRASGIYWGGTGTDIPYYSFNQHFTPFTFNFGRNLDRQINWNILDRFYESKAYKEWKPVNDFMYAFN